MLQKIIAMIQVSKENDVRNSEYLIAILGVANTFPRILWGALSDRPQISAIVVTGISTFLCELLCETEDSIS